MTDFLTAVKSVSRKDADTKEDLLTAVTSTKWTKDAKPEQEALHPVRYKAVEDAASTEQPAAGVKTPEEVLQALRSQPTVDALVAVLRPLVYLKAFNGTFTLYVPSPLGAQIVATLVNTIVPDFWPVLVGAQKQILRSCLLSLNGFNAILARLRLLCVQAQANKVGDVAPLITLYAELLEDLLGAWVAAIAWTNLNIVVPETVRRNMLWKEHVNLFGSGTVVSALAQAEDIIRTSTVKKNPYRFASGSEYATWLGSMLASFVIAYSGSGRKLELQAAAQLMTKALSIGYPQQLVKALFTDLIIHSVKTNDGLNNVRSMLEQLPYYSQRQVLERALRWLSSVLPDSDAEEEENATKSLSAIAAFLNTLMRDNEPVKTRFLAVLVDPALSSTFSLPLRRACIAALATAAPNTLQDILEKCMTTFGDNLFMQYAPILQQEAVAQTLLLAAGYVHRSTLMSLKVLARSSIHLQGVSNRLNASSQRGRWLGMLVGTAISGLVDKEGSKMNFGIDEMRGEESARWMALANCFDGIGELKDMLPLLQTQNGPLGISQRARRKGKMDRLPQINGKPIFGPARPPANERKVQTELEGPQVTELPNSDSDEEEHHELKPYAKPDSDPEDSDEDATLVSRNKPRAPVYIRDLMAGLRDDKNHDRFQLALRHAAALIRRKSGIGAELKDHAVEMASILCNLGDVFETENFEELKMQAMIAVLLSNVKVMGPWMARAAFDGDYSLGQRCIILSALGLGGRELAGFKDEDDELNPSRGNTSFPSKRLPDRLHAIYSPDSLRGASAKQLHSAAKSLEHQLIQPLALRAADQRTAHLNAVKVRTFSSRMDVERTKRRPAPNQLAMAFGEALFFPLASRYQREIAAYGSTSVYDTPLLLTTFLKTLALLLHASGPSTVCLASVTAELWDLLLSLRVRAMNDITILEALLFALLTLLEVNTDLQRLASDHGRQLMETQEWVDMVFERIGSGGMTESGGGNSEEAKIRTLAAGVLIQVRAVVEAEQKRLFGGTIG